MLWGRSVCAKSWWRMPCRCDGWVYFMLLSQDSFGIESSVFWWSVVLQHYLSTLGGTLCSRLPWKMHLGSRMRFSIEHPGRYAARTGSVMSQKGCWAEKTHCRRETSFLTVSATQPPLRLLKPTHPIPFSSCCSNGSPGLQLATLTWHTLQIFYKTKGKEKTCYVPYGSAQRYYIWR